jgi:hypothetical protein
MSSLAIARHAAGQVLRRRKADQLERFEALAGELGTRYEAARLHDAPQLESPDWDARRPALEAELLPHPRRAFLRQPALAALLSPPRGLLEPELRWLSRNVSAPRLPLLLEEDPIGSPPLVPVEDQDYLTSARMVDDLHHVARFTRETAVDPRELGLVVEWGGGYGSLARLFARLHGGELAYAIVDAPLMSCLQWLFLASVLGPERVELCVEEPVSIEPGKIALVPHGLWHDVRHDADLFVSAWGLSEASPAAQLAVAASHWFGARHLLLAAPAGSPLSERAQLDGASASAIGPFLRGHEYVLR